MVGILTSVEDMYHFRKIVTHAHAHTQTQHPFNECASLPNRNAEVAEVGTQPPSNAVALPAENSKAFVYLCIGPGAS